MGILRRSREAIDSQNKARFLKQNGTIDDYIIEFQELAVETGYQNHDLCHRFMVGLKEKVRDHCLMTVPPPFTMGEWMERARQIQRQMDLSKALRDGANVLVSFNKNNKYPTIVPTQITATITSGEIITRRTTNGNQGTQQSTPSEQRHSEEQGNQWRSIEGEHNANFCGKFGHMQKL